VKNPGIKRYPQITHKDIHKSNGFIPAGGAVRRSYSQIHNGRPFIYKYILYYSTENSGGKFIFLSNFSALKI
jgi:hypothetical protein